MVDGRNDLASPKAEDILEKWKHPQRIEEQYSLAAGTRPKGLLGRWIIFHSISGLLGVL